MSSFLRGWSPVNSVRNSTDPSPARAQRKAEPPPTDEEMQEKMQYMISLQYAAQQQANPFPELGVVKDDRAAAPPPAVQLPMQGTPVPGATITHAAAVNAAAAAGLPPPPVQKVRSIIHGQGPYQTYLPESTYARETANLDGVGQGHIFFPNDYPKPEHQPILSSEPMPHYGAGHEMDDPDHVDPTHQHHPRSHHHHHHSHCRAYLFRCVQYWRNAEALHRSFCYSAIDGMLTGAGILAAFVGMGIVTARSSEGMHLFVVAFSLASCSSDAICMALGHIWTTYVLANASANERRTERLSFEQNRADAKGKLVDMLLSRGMLKIDAMSIADTLEGYPDIFVSALVGDSGYTLGDESLLSSGSSQGQLGFGQGFHLDDDNFGSFQGLSRAHASYGRFNEWEHDPETASVKAALGESRTEAVIMMLSFALFSVLPSLIFLWLSNVMNVNPDQSGGTSVTSMTVSLTSFIMLLLGIWKSKFFDSNWIIFGIETVVVLLTCIMSAFFIGAGLATFIPALEGLSPIKAES